MNRIIDISGVGMVREGKQILKDINLSVNTGDFIAITGPNGGGKTTLLRIILRLLKPTDGNVRYFTDGTEVKRLSIGYLPQKTASTLIFQSRYVRLYLQGCSEYPELTKTCARL